MRKATFSLTTASGNVDSVECWVGPVCAFNRPGTSASRTLTIDAPLVDVYFEARGVDGARLDAKVVIANDGGGKVEALKAQLTIQGGIATHEGKV